MEKKRTLNEIFLLVIVVFNSRMFTWFFLRFTYLSWDSHLFIYHIYPCLYILLLTFNKYFKVFANSNSWVICGPASTDCFCS